jgi:hypothetical protein
VRPRYPDCRRPPCATLSRSAHLEARRIAGCYASLKRFLGIPNDVVLDWSGDARLLLQVPRRVELDTDLPLND